MTAGNVYTVAGNHGGSGGVTGDGGAATSALLNTPVGVVLDASGNLYIGDNVNNRVQMVPKTNGTYFGQSMTANDIYTIAGSSAGTSGTTGNGGLATSALLNTPKGLALDSSSNLYITDYTNNRIQVVAAANGTYFGVSMTANDIYTIAGSSTGTSGHTGNGGAPTSALLYEPFTLNFDSSGNLYISDWGNNRIQMVSAAGGTFFGVSTTANDIYTIAGSSSGSGGSTGDGGAPTSALLNEPLGVAFDPSGNFYIADYTNNRIKAIPTTNGTYFGTSMTANDIYTLFGGLVTVAAGSSGGGGLATNARLSGPVGVALDSSGNLYIGDVGNNRIQMVPKTNGTNLGISMTAGDIFTIAGNSGGAGGHTGDGSAATSALLSGPNSPWVDSSGNLYFSDNANNRIQMVPIANGSYFGQSMTANDIYTIVGNSAGTSGTAGDSGAAASALLNNPIGVTVDSSGNLYIADYGNDRIQMVPIANGSYFGQSMTANDIYTIAGSSTGTSGTAGDSGAATSAFLNGTRGIALDSSGNLYIADSLNNRIQMVAKTNGSYFGQSMTANDIYTIAGSSAGTSGTTGDGGLATSALLNAPYGVTFDASGNLYISEITNNRVQKVPVANGTYFGISMTANDIYTIAGSSSGTVGATGNGGAGTSALLNNPKGIVTDSLGNLYVSGITAITSSASFSTDSGRTSSKPKRPQ